MLKGSQVSAPFYIKWTSVSICAGYAEPRRLVDFSERCREDLGAGPEFGIALQLGEWISELEDLMARVWARISLHRELWTRGVSRLDDMTVDRAKHRIQFMSGAPVQPIVGAASKSQQPML